MEQLARLFTSDGLKNALPQKNDQFFLDLPQLLQNMTSKIGRRDGPMGQSSDKAT